jgi:hypothetical protein
MTESTDFAALYRELGLEAGCTRETLREAYRRQVSRLHPDVGGDAQDTGRLQRLTRDYRAAIAFHDRYGRLPGAPGQGGTLPPASATQAYLRAAESAHPTPETATEATAAAGFGRISRWFIAASLLGVGALGVALLQPLFADLIETPQGAASAATAVGATPGGGQGQATFIATGMGKDTVQDIQEEPLDRHAPRWDYGPSWVEFRCDKVVDWYSSPLWPLRVPSERAPAQEAASLRDARAC